MENERNIEWWKILPSTVGVALGLLVAGYFGYIWITVGDNKSENDSQQKLIDEHAKTITKLKSDSVTQVQVGTCASEYEKLKHTGESILRTSTCMVVFNPPFGEIPNVMVGLSEVNTSREGIAPGLRIKVEAVDVSTTGASINFSVWHDTDVYGARAQWIAIGR